MEVFGFDFYTQDGDYTVVVGLAELGFAESCAEALKAARLPVFKNGDPYRLDKDLADWLLENASKHTLALGAALRVRKALSPRGATSGGVLGSVLEPAESSDGALEKIQDGLWLYTRPEGPGTVMCCSAKTALNLEEKFNSYFAYPARLRVEKVLEALKNAEIETFLMICDGSGEGCFGCAVAQDANNKIEYYC